MKKLFRWLLSNLLLILVIIGVIYCYMFWGNLTGKNTPAGKAVAYLSEEFDGIGRFVDGVKNKQAMLAGQASAAEKENTAAVEIAVEVPTEAVVEVTMPGAGNVTENATENATENVSKTVPTAVESETNVRADLNAAKDKIIMVDLAQVPQEVPPEVPQADMQQVDTQQSEYMEESDMKAELTPAGDIESVAVAVDETSALQQSSLQQPALQQQVEQLATDEQQPASISYSHNNMRVQQTSDGAVEVQPQPHSLTTKIDDAITTSKESRELAETDKTTALDNQQNNAQTLNSVTELSATDNSAVDAAKEKLATNSFVPAEITDKLEISGVSSALDKKLPVDNLSVVSESGSVPKVLSTPAAKMSMHDTWMAARKAFYMKNFSLSEKSYHAVIAGTNNNFDAYGELGNVYFHQGKYKYAAEAYLRAGTILVRKGNIQRAQSLLQVLQQLDIPKANQLQQQIEAALS